MLMQEMQAHKKAVQRMGKKSKVRLAFFLSLSNQNPILDTVPLF